MSNTKIMRCTCKHEDQDEYYGKGKRLFNRTLKGWRCTVCDTHVIDNTVKDKTGSK